jgi:2-polyprenyl-3-methyl-5-hydroxy-6-metoxy-1,4-benzoquinol methylase
MGFIILTSDNENLSYVIKKNPQTSPHTRPVRKGICIGWFFNDKYIIKFNDLIDSVSFLKLDNDEYDYLPYMQYCAPILMACIVKEMFSTCVNQGSSDDKVGKCSIEQGIMKLGKKAVNLINKLNLYITNYNIIIVETDVPQIYNFKIQSDHSTISELLQYAYILGYILNCMSFGFNEKPDKAGLDKIIKIMNHMNVPYYIRYIVKNQMIGRAEFQRIKKELEKSPDHLINMVYGNTQDQRYEFISNMVFKFCSNNSENNIHLVDIGCGEGYYIKKLLSAIKTKKISKIQYHAHDIEEKEMDMIDQMISSDPDYQIVKTYRSIDLLINKLKEYKSDRMMIIFSEVIEHIPLTEVKNFMIKIIKEINFNTMIITTPTYEFNSHYMMSGSEFRHPDHKQEFTKQQFIEFMDQIIIETGITMTNTYYPVGDQIDGFGMSQGIELNPIHQ